VEIYVNPFWVCRDKFVPSLLIHIKATAHDYYSQWNNKIKKIDMLKNENGQIKRENGGVEMKGGLHSFERLFFLN
jgi:hypothetical protein